MKRKVSRLKCKITSEIEQNGQIVHSSMHSDLKLIAEEVTKEVEMQNSFHRMFWEQQLKAAKLKDHRQMRWHPAMIRWSIYLKAKSTSGYEGLRHLLKLPSSRTLRDYTHLYTSKFGFQAEVDQQLYDEFEVASLAEWQKCVGLIFDEMKIKDGIVYNKHNCEIVGYTNLGDVTNQLLEYVLRKMTFRIQDLQDLLWQNTFAALW